MDYSLLLGIEKISTINLEEDLNIAKDYNL